MTIYNLVIPEERTDKETNDVKTYWHRVGTAFSQKRSSGFNLVIPEGMTITGRVLMLERNAKEPEAVAEVFEEAQ